MNAFQFKIKSYDNEEGEYTAWQKAESGTIIQLILNHWFNETLPNNLDIVVIKNDRGDQLVLDHERKDVFRYFFIPRESGRTYYYKMTDITLMFFTLESFFNNLPDDLMNNMNKTTDDWRWVKGDFLQKNFTYRLNPWRVTKHFTNHAFGLMIWFLVLVGVLAVADSVAKMVLGVILVVITLFGWRLKHKVIWYLDQRDLTIKLSRGDRFIHVKINAHLKSIPKADIVSINQYFVYDEDWWVPVFTEINFQNGSVLNITDLIIPQRMIPDKFHFESAIFHEVKKNKIALQKRTAMAAYFPEAWKKNYLR